MSFGAKRKPWGIIADDLTGATDVAAAFAVEGFSAQVVLDWKLIPSLQCDVVLLTTDSRYHPPVIAGRLVDEAVRFLAEHSIELIYKKIDSTLKGNLVSEMNAVRKVNKRPTVFCPANPLQGRTLWNGMLDVRGEVLNITAILQLQGCDACVVLKQPVGKYPFDQIDTNDLPCDSSGHDGSKSKNLADRVFYLADAQCDSDLDAIVEAATRSSHNPLLVGSAGLAAAVARKLHWIQKENDGTDSALSEINLRASESFKSDKPTVLLIGSTNPVTIQQVEVLVAGGLAFECVLGSDPVANLRSSLTLGRNVVVKVPMENRDTESIVDDMEAIAKLLESGLAGSLLLSGGDTAQLFLAHLCPQAIHVLGEILPGLAVGKLIGGRANGLTLVTKPGGFGTVRSLCEAVGLL